jgi:hypothetical protein
VGARGLYESALEARTSLLGPEHPDTLTTLQNLAGTLQGSGRSCRRAAASTSARWRPGPASSGRSTQTRSPPCRTSRARSSHRASCGRPGPLRARAGGQDPHPRAGAPGYAHHPAEPRGHALGAGRPCGRPGPLRARAGGQDPHPRAGAPGHAHHPAEPRGHAPGAGRPCGRPEPLRARAGGHDPHPRAEEHPNTLTTLQNLAGTLQAQGELCRRPGPLRARAGGQPRDCRR